MLPISAHWCDLEGYQRGVTVLNYFWRKWENLRNYLCTVKAIYLPFVSFFLGQHAMLRGPAFSEWYFYIQVVSVCFVCMIVFDSFQGNDSLMEIFKINSEYEAKKHLQKKQKKARRKAAK